MVINFPDKLSGGFWFEISREVGVGDQVVQQKPDHADLRFLPINHFHDTVL